METAEPRVPVPFAKPAKRPFLSGIVLAAGSSQRLQQSAPRSSAAVPPTKQLLEFRGRPLLQYVIEQIARAKLDELVVVLGHDAEVIRNKIVLPGATTISTTDSTTAATKASPTEEARSGAALGDSRAARVGPIRFVVNPDYARGQSSSLLAGLRAVAPQAKAAAIFLGDQPGLETPTIDGLIEKFFELAAGPLACAPNQDDSLAPLILRPLYSAPADVSRPDSGDAVAIPGHPVFFSRAVWTMWDALRALEGDQGARALFASRPEWLHEVRVAAAAPCDIDTWEDWEHWKNETAGCSARG